MKYLSLLISTLAFATSALANPQLAQLEKTFDGKIGVYAIDTSNNKIIAYRENERFPVQSTFKLMGVAALLKQTDKDKNLLQEKIRYTKNDLIPWHPVTGQYVDEGMTLEALSAATITYSDNLAINLIMKRLGGPQKVTNFARSIDNKSFNIKHYEGKLNSNPTNSDDTATPKDMALSVQQLTLGDTLTASQKDQLITWMKDDTVGYKKIRAGIPLGWVVADKTGSGDYGIANDIGMMWSPACKPVILAIYTVQNKKDAKNREDIVAAATTIVFDELAKSNHCM